MGVLVLVGVHRHEAVELHEARIDPPAQPRIGRGHAVDHVGLEPGEGLFLGQLVGHGRRQPRVDGRAHEGHGAGAAVLVVLGHQGGGGQHGRPRLADGHHVRARTQQAQHLAHMVEIVVEIEAAGVQRHVAGVGPVGDEHLVVLQEGLHRAAQQGGVVARQRRDDQHGRLQLPAAGLAHVGHVAAEMGELHPGAGPHLGLGDAHRLAVDLHGIDVPGRAAVAAGQVGEQVGAGEQPPSQVAVLGRIERRRPEAARGARREPERRGGVVAGFIHRIEHTQGSRCALQHAR